MLRHFPHQLKLTVINGCPRRPALIGVLRHASFLFLASENLCYEIVHVILLLLLRVSGKGAVLETMKGKDGKRIERAENNEIF